MTHLVFVFGTLKQGFPLHDSGLKGSRFLYRCKTVAPYPLVIAGPYFAPMMFDEPGTGLRVVGELYAVDDAGLARLDAIESVGIPGNLRSPISVAPLHKGPPVAAFAYMKSRLLAKPIHATDISDYQDRRFITRAQRSER